MFGPIRSVIFDFDGTLVNSMPSVIKGLGEAVTHGSGKVVPTDELVKSFGPAPLDVLRLWVPAEKVESAYQHWINFERSLGPEHCVVFPGAAEMLKVLRERGLQLGVFTGRDRAGTLRIMQHHGWKDTYFSEATMACGDDGLPTKPNPDSLVHLMKKMNLDPATTLMVGDHPYDAMAGRAAGTKTAAALWDLPASSKSERARFRDGWKKWDNVPCDLRLESPGSLVEWLGFST